MKFSQIYVSAYDQLFYAGSIQLQLQNATDNQDYILHKHMDVARSCAIQF